MSTVECALRAFVDMWKAMKGSRGTLEAAAKAADDDDEEGGGGG